MPNTINTTKEIKPPLEKKYCKECGSELKKIKGESLPRFLKKQYCSTACGRKYMKLHKLGWWQHKGPLD